MVGFGFARHALVALLEALGIGAGDEVVLSPLTCQVVPLALLSRGVRPRWADLDPATLNLSPAAAAAACTPRTRAILFQHTYGLPGGVAEVLEVARARGIASIEDRAQCMPLGPVRGTAAIYSNNLLKPLPAGSGGLAATDDVALADRVRELQQRLPPAGTLADLRLGLEAAIHARILTPRSYWPALELYRRLAPAYRALTLEQQIAGQVTATAFRPSRYQERRGLRALAGLDRLTEHRRRTAERYREALAGHPALRTPTTDPGQPLLYYPILTDAKGLLLESARMARQEIIPWPGGTVIYPIETSDGLAQLGYTGGSCPEAEAVAARLVGLPTHPAVTERERERLIRFLVAWRPTGPLDAAI